MDPGLFVPVGGLITAVVALVTMFVKMPREDTAAAVDTQAKVLTGSNEFIDQLQEELTSVRAQRTALEAELRAERKEKAELESQLSRLRRREEQLLERLLLSGGKPPPEASADA